MGVGIPGATRPEAVVEQAARVVDAEGASPAILPLVFNEGLLLGDRDPRRVTNAVRDPEGPGVELRARTAERTTRLLVAGYLGELHDSAPAPQDGIDLVEQAGELARAVVEEAAEYARFGQLEADATPRVVDVHLPELSGTIARPSAGPVAESPHTDVVLAPWDPRQTGY
jgi:hypothetical protein